MAPPSSSSSSSFPRPPPPPPPPQRPHPTSVGSTSSTSSSINKQQRQQHQSTSFPVPPHPQPAPQAAAAPHHAPANNNRLSSPVAPVPVVVAQQQQPSAVAAAPPPPPPPPPKAVLGLEGLGVTTATTTGTASSNSGFSQPQPPLAPPGGRQQQQYQQQEQYHQQPNQQQQQYQQQPPPSFPPPPGPHHHHVIPPAAAAAAVPPTSTSPVPSDITSVSSFPSSNNLQMQQQQQQHSMMMPPPGAVFGQQQQPMQQPSHPSHIPYSVPRTPTPSVVVPPPPPVGATHAPPMAPSLMGPPQLQQQQYPMAPPPQPMPPPIVGGGAYNNALPPQPPPPPTQHHTTTAGPYRPPPPPTQQQQQQPAYGGSSIGSGSSGMMMPPPGPPPPGPQQQQYQQQQQQRPPPAQHQNQQQPQHGIDPSQMPRPPLFTSPQNDQPVIYYPRAALNLSHQQPVLPPNGEIRYVVKDDGNASPRLLRSTVYQIPQSRGVWHDTGDIIMGAVCTPLTTHSQDYVPRPRRSIITSSTSSSVDAEQDGVVVEEEYRDPENIPVIVPPYASVNNKNGSSQLLEPPPRCYQCNAYVNPFFGGENNSTCNICGSTSWTNAETLRNLSNMLPMQLGTVEYEVDGPYITRPSPIQNIHVYAIDLTSTHLQYYINCLVNLGRSLYQHNYRQHQQQSQSQGVSFPSVRIGVCFFSSIGIAVHNHDEKTEEGEGEAPIVIASDVTDQPFNPIPVENWTIDLMSNSEQCGGLQSWEQFCFNQLPNDVAALRQKSKGRNAYGYDGLELSCGGAAVAMMADALRDTGGHATLITWRRPNFGKGSISHQRQARLKSTIRVQEDYGAYTPLQQLKNFKTNQDVDSSKFYRNLGIECVQNRVSVDIMIHTSPPSNSATSPIHLSQYRQQQQMSYLDLATLGELCHVTSGRLMWLNAAKDWETAFQEDLSRQFQCFIGWDAVFKLRCSAGVQVKSFFCNNGIVAKQEGLGDIGGGSSEIELSCVGPSTTIAVELEHRVGGISKNNNPFVYLQSALLYTNPYSGKRRVRVSTLAIRVASTPLDVFKSVDYSALSTCIIRRAVSRLRQYIPLGSADESSAATQQQQQPTPRSRARNALYNECVQLLAKYRKAVGGYAQQQQLILPDTINLLPLFVMSLMKSPMLRPGMPYRIGGTEAVCLRPTNDERAFFAWHASNTGATPWTSTLLVYPRIFNVNIIDVIDRSISIGSSSTTGYGQWQPPSSPESQQGFVLMPPPTRLSMEALADDSIYIIDSGLELFLYVGKDVPQDVKGQATTLGATSTADSVSTAPNNDWYQVARNIIWQLRAYNSTSIGRGSESEFRPNYPCVIVTVRKHEGQVIDTDDPYGIEGTGGEPHLLDLMMDDAVGGERDYGDFLIRLHQKVRELQQT